MLQAEKSKQLRDHGGGLDAARATFGGARADWIDLSTGINPVPYPVTDLPQECWTALPDSGAQDALCNAARRFWQVPPDRDIVAAPGASALIAALPAILTGARVAIPGPTYNEHAAAFRVHGWQVEDIGPGAAMDAAVLVHPNNPDGRVWSRTDLACAQIVVDESFADIDPSLSLLPQMNGRGRITLKSFGKFWGLAGVRLGFAIGDPSDIARLRDLLGPWAVSGPSLHIGQAALSDEGWANATRSRLARDAARLDDLVAQMGATCAGGTTLFRLYETADAKAFQTRLARHRIWTRIFPYSERWVRLGLPAPDQWPRIEAALRA